MTHGHQPSNETSKAFESSIHARVSIHMFGRDDVIRFTKAGFSCFAGENLGMATASGHTPDFVYQKYFESSGYWADGVHLETGDKILQRRFGGTRIFGQTVRCFS